MAVDDPGDDVGQVAVRLDGEQLAGFDQRGDDRPVLGAAVGAGEQGVLAVEGNRAVILPMSGKKLRSIIAGTRCMGAKSDDNTSSGARSVKLFMLRWLPATSWS